MAHLQGRARSLAWWLWLVAAVGSTASAPLRAHEFADSLVRLRAVAADGSQTFGSGVVIEINLVATACHVTREAKTVEVAHGAEIWIATVESGSAMHDFCLIRVPQLSLPAVAIRGSGSLQLGERVIAAGFPGGGDIVVSDGVVEGLYPYDGGSVIRTSATFEAGASGGGLFDAKGALVGLLAFKARSGTKLHFALPADWALPGSMVSSFLGPVAVSSERTAFWERPRAAQPPFLGHAVLEAASQR